MADEDMSSLLVELANIANKCDPHQTETCKKITAKIKLLEAAPLCAVVLDDDGIAKEANKLFDELMGPVWKFANFEFAQSASDDKGKSALAAAISAVRSGASKREKLRNVEMLTLASGLPIKAHFDWFVGAGADGEGITLFGDPCSDDLLEQRKKDAELIDFFQNAPIAMHWLSGTGHVMWANQTELDVLGYTAEEYIGQPIMKFCPDEEELVLEIFKTLGSGNIIKDVPVRFRTKGGKIVPLLIDSNVAYKIDETGQKAFNHTRCFIRDDTGRRVHEARAEAMLRETERSLKLLDAFVSRTLHLVRTPCHVVQASLGMVASNLHSLASKLPPREASALSDILDETENLLAISMHQLHGVNSLISDASDVQRFDQGASLTTIDVPTKLRKLCREAVDNAKDLAKPHVSVRFEASAGPDVVTLDAEVLRRALDQLLRNAAAATAEGGSISLRVSVETHSPSADAVQDGTALRFEVHDNGCGLPISNSSANIFHRYCPGSMACPPHVRGTVITSTPDSSPNMTPEPKLSAASVVGGAAPGGAAPLEAAVEFARSGLESALALNHASIGTSGLGIGLNLTYSLVRALGGELRVESAPGDTRFSFVLRGLHSDASSHESSESYVAVGAGVAALPPRTSPVISRATPPVLAEWTRSGRAVWTVSSKREKRVAEEPTAPAPRPALVSSGEEQAKSTVDADDEDSDSMESLLGELAAATAAVQACSGGGAHTERFVQEPTMSKVVQASSVAGQGLRALHAPHVLVVEDSEMCAMVLIMMLKKLGCSTDHAMNGVEALERLEGSEPGLYSIVLMDLRMPVMDGFEATDVIKNKLKLTVPVVALTAEDGLTTRDKCKSTGFDDFAAKPLKYDALAALLEKHTKHKVVCDACPAAFPVAA